MGQFIAVITVIVVLVYVVGNLFSTKDEEKPTGSRRPPQARPRRLQRAHRPFSNSLSSTPHSAHR